MIRFIVLLYYAVFEEPEDPASKSFFTEIVASISDVKFSRNGRYVLSRDYLTGTCYRTIQYSVYC